MFKQCTKCDEWKSIDNFQNGHNRCKHCAKEYMRQWANNNREKINKNQLVYHTTVVGRANVLFNAAIKRAKQKNEQFNLTHEDVIKGISTGFCEKTLFPFDLSLRERRKSEYKINPYSPSIDKKNPKGIYEPSNVQYVCAWYNLAKGQMSEDDLIIFCKRIAELNR